MERPWDAAWSDKAWARRLRCLLQLVRAEGLKDSHAAMASWRDSRVCAGGWWRVVSIEQNIGVQLRGRYNSVG